MTNQNQPSRQQIHLVGKTPSFPCLVTALLGYRTYESYKEVGKIDWVDFWAIVPTLFFVVAIFALVNQRMNRRK